MNDDDDVQPVSWWDYERVYCAGCGKQIDPGQPRITLWESFPAEGDPADPAHSWHELACLHAYEEHLGITEP
jgi:hypothetical protein